jgi:hypothetical protein
MDHPLPSNRKSAALDGMIASERASRSGGPGHVRRASIHGYTVARVVKEAWQLRESIAVWIREILTSRRRPRAGLRGSDASSGEAAGSSYGRHLWVIDRG